MKWKVLLIVPHQDDELLVGGGLLKYFAKSTEYQVQVIFTTNGDYFPHEAKVRIQESLHVLTKLYGIEESHIYLLGYGNEWQGTAHLYNEIGHKVLTSLGGRRETYGIAGHEEYRKLKSGRHSAYCRDNFKQDLQELIADIRADIIMAVDYDKNPDHKAVSLMTEECIGELLAKMPDYRPVVLKRYGYDGVWKGAADFFEIPRRRTILSQENIPYDTEDKICIAMPPECSTPHLRRNFLYRAARCYRTQEAWQKADEIINIDEVFWRRRTDNLLYEATIEASSGNPEYIRDFKLFDCADVLQKDLLIKECAWLPDIHDQEKEIHIHFQAPKRVERINIYAIGRQKTDSMSGELLFDTGMRLQTGDMCLNGKKNAFIFEAQEGVQDIRFRVNKCTGNPIGITQMEVFSAREDELPEDLRQLVFQEDWLPYNGYTRMLIKIESLMFRFRRKVSRWIPNKYVLKRRYPQLREKESCLLGYRIRYIWERLRSDRKKIWGSGCKE